MKLLQLDSSTYYNAQFISSIVESPYLGMRKQITVELANHTFKLTMSAADFLRALDSGNSIIDLSAYYQRPY